MQRGFCHYIQGLFVVVPSACLHVHTHSITDLCAEYDPIFPLSLTFSTFHYAKHKKFQALPHIYKDQVSILHRQLSCVSSPCSC